MTDRDYSALPGIRRSDLWRISQSPLHYKYYVDNPQPETPALTFGRALHELILTPKSFNDNYTIAPAVDRRTKSGREKWEEFMATRNGRTIIAEDDYKTMLDMRREIYHHPIADMLLTNNDTSTDHETAFVWTDSATGEECKIKVDALSQVDGKPVIVDYKTTESCADHMFERAARRYGYKLQVGMYTEGVWYGKNDLEEYGFVFVAQEKKAPYAIRVYIATEDYIFEGTDLFHEYIGLYHSCKESGKWYGYEGASNTMTELFGEED